MERLSKSKTDINCLLVISGQVVKRLLLSSIKFYQLVISPLKAPSCRFYPTCSQYFYEAVKTQGAMQGCYLGMRRLLKCHPFHSGGYDPVKQGGK